MLETSAQIFRLFGDRELRREIDDLLSRFDRIATSHFVYREFESVVGGLYGSVERALRALPGQDRSRSIEDLLGQFVFGLPPVVRGGPKLLSWLTAQIAQTFPSRSITPRQLENWCMGQRQAALVAFHTVHGQDLRISGTLVDRTTCCSWPGQDWERCSGVPHPSTCRLKEMCLDAREEFLSNLGTVADSDLAESAWIRDNLPSLQRLHGCDLLRFVGKNPNPLGDTIIFLETPAEWNILTRDRAFRILRDRHRPSISVYCVRSPRYMVEAPCELRVGRSRDVAPKSGVLKNHSATGVAIESHELFAIGDKLSISSSQLAAPRNGFVIWRKAAGGAWRYGVKFAGTPATIPVE